MRLHTASVVCLISILCNAVAIAEKCSDFPNIPSDRIYTETFRLSSLSLSEGNYYYIYYDVQSDFVVSLWAYYETVYTTQIGTDDFDLYASRASNNLYPTVDNSDYRSDSGVPNEFAEIVEIYGFREPRCYAIGIYAKPGVEGDFYLKVTDTDLDQYVPQGAGSCTFNYQDTSSKHMLIGSLHDVNSGNMKEVLTGAYMLAGEYRRFHLASGYSWGNISIILENFSGSNTTAVIDVYVSDNEITASPDSSNYQYYSPFNGSSTESIAVRLSSACLAIGVYAKTEGAFSMRITPVQYKRASCSSFGDVPRPPSFGLWPILSGSVKSTASGYSNYYYDAIKGITFNIKLVPNLDSSSTSTPTPTYSRLFVATAAYDINPWKDRFQFYDETVYGKTELSITITPELTECYAITVDYSYLSMFDIFIEPTGESSGASKNFSGFILVYGLWIGLWMMLFF